MYNTITLALCKTVLKLGNCDSNSILVTHIGKLMKPVIIAINYWYLVTQTAD